MAAVDTPRNPHITMPPPTVTSAGAIAHRGAAGAMGASSANVRGGLGGLPSVRVGEDGFASEATVDAWVRSGVAVRSGSLLTIHDGRRFLLRDAVRVLGRRNGDTDPYGFTGRVDALRDFIRRGANISADALRLGPAVYDIEYGFIAIAEA
jgi:hypothetical protein